MSEAINLAELHLTTAQLDVVRGHVQAGPSDEHYPNPEDRLFTDRPGVEINHEQRRLVLPRDGAWNVANHPNRTKAPANLRHLLAPEIPNANQSALPPAETARWAEAGYWIDQYGLPVPEAAVQMLEDPTIGVATGQGSYWQRAVNLTSDLAVVRQQSPDHPHEILLVERVRERQKAFPGGFGDPDDRDGAHTARRETGEETGLMEIGGQDRQLSAGLLIGSGATAHALSGNEFHVVDDANNEYLFDTPLRPDPKETAGAGWYTLPEIAELQAQGQFFPHHLGHMALLAADLSNRH